MANSKAALKRAKQSLSRRSRNLHFKTLVRGRIRAVREAVEAGDKDLASQALIKATSVLHRVSGKGIIHDRMADRKLSRLAQAVNKMG